MLNEVIELYLDDIIPNRFQPREIFNEESLKELSASIKEHGVIQPIIVRKIGEKYEIIAGERRYKASALAGLTKIPAIVRNLDDKEASKVALLENLQRQDLTAIEEARTYQKILELDTMTQEELGKTMGKSQASIANKLRLLSLSDEVQEALLNNQISERHARSLLNLKNGNEQIEMLNRIIRNRMTVKELDNEIRKIKGGTQTELSLEMNDDIFTTTDDKLNENFYDKQDQISINKEPEHKLPEIQLENSLDISAPIEIKEEQENQENNIEEQPKENIINSNLEQNSNFIPNFNEKVEERSNSFIPNFAQIKEPINIPEENDLINNKFIEQFKYKDALDIVKSVIPQLENKGLKAKIEEYDLSGKYQIIINIDKNSNN